MFKRLEKYEHIQGIYRGYNDILKESVEKALMNMSEEIRDYIVKNCWVISIDRGASWPVPILQEEGKKWLIAISDNLNEEEAISAVEKEFAHVYLQYLWSIM